jgi:hypothetical protein
MLDDMPGDTDSHPDQQDRTKNENAEENSHRGENNKGAEGVLTALRAGNRWR